MCKKLKILLFMLPLLIFSGYTERKDSIDLKLLAKQMIMEYYQAKFKGHGDINSVLKKYMTDMMIEELMRREPDCDPLFYEQDDVRNVKGAEFLYTKYPDWIKVLIIDYTDDMEKNKNLNNLSYLEINLHFINIDEKPLINAVDIVIHGGGGHASYCKTRYANKNLSQEEMQQIEVAKTFQNEEFDGYVPLGLYQIMDEYFGESKDN